MIYSFVLLYSDDKKQPFYLTCDSIEEARQQYKQITKAFRHKLNWEFKVYQRVKEYNENN